MSSVDIARRRTFAIISHPDAGKTTLTEKLLLYGGALHLAGSVTARKNQRATTSDWMELEKQRGISVSSTVLQFEYKDCVVNLLDTPGHKDFSEDTYRVLTAVDAAVMVIDAGKGIESQTLKLFEVCRRRGVPIFTFINKLDRPSRPTIDLLDELEKVLGISSCPMNWPLGDGIFFKGVYDRIDHQVHLFERTQGGMFRAPEKVAGIHDELVKKTLDEQVYQRVCEELELLEVVGADFDVEKIHSGQLTPVFFGSAMNNFGVQMMLDAFLKYAPPPVGRKNNLEKIIQPDQEAFSGFVFKIQANMNPKHRDRVAFIRIVSGCFKRDMTASNPRTGQKLRLANSQRLFAQERETVNEAWAGDVVGLVGNYDFLIGDTLTEDITIQYDVMPRFAPECFAYLHNDNAGKFKRFREGLDQLLKEGVAQSFELFESYQRIPLLGAVGPLQFDVLKYRMESEYNAESRLELASWNQVRWLRAKDPTVPKKNKQGQSIPPPVNAAYGTTLGLDERGEWVALFSDKISANFFETKNSDDFEISLFPFTQ
jgi:peptide chain release factor 3